MPAPSPTAGIAAPQRLGDGDHRIRLFPMVPSWSSMKALRTEEEWARQVMSLALGVPVLQHDDGSVGGMHDLDVTARRRQLGGFYSFDRTQFGDPFWVIVY